VGGDGGDADIAAARAAAAGAAPISDVRASAEYRSAMAEVVARRAIAAAITRAGGGEVPIPASDALYGA
jgi:CO/xanthine dehydrogenase FAD-binding subunit